MDARKDLTADTKKRKINAEKIKNLRPIKHECASIPSQYMGKR